MLLGQYAFDRQTVKRLKDYVSGGGALVVNIEQVSDLFGEDFTGLARSWKKAEVKGTLRNRMNGAETKINESYDYEAVVMRSGRILWEDESGGVLAAINHYGKGNVITTMVNWMVPREDMGKGGGEWGLDRLVRGGEMPLVKLLMDQIVGEVLPVEVKGDIEFGVNKRTDGWLVYLINNKGVIKFTTTAEKLDFAATVKVEVNMRNLSVADVRELREEKDVAWDHGRNSFSINVGPGDIKIILIATKAQK
jgi:hypothetical protein